MQANKNCFYKKVSQSAAKHTTLGHDPIGFWKIKIIVQKKKHQN